MRCSKNAPCLKAQTTSGWNCFRGGKMVTYNDKVITDVSLLQNNQRVKTILKNSSFESTITQINNNDQPDF